MKYFYILITRINIHEQSSLNIETLLSVSLDGTGLGGARSSIDYSLPSSSLRSSFLFGVQNILQVEAFKLNFEL